MNIKHSDTPHSLVTAFAKSPEAKASPFEEYAAKLRAETERKIGYLQMAADVCADLGYDISGLSKYNLSSMLEKAVDEASSINGYAHGDDYKVFDHDMARPDKETLESVLLPLCKQNKVPKIVIPEEPELAFTAP